MWGSAQLPFGTPGLGCSPCAQGALGRVAGWIRPLPCVSKGSSSSLHGPLHWAAPGALRGQSIPQQGWQGPGPAPPLLLSWVMPPPTTVCPEHETWQQHLHRVCQRHRHRERLQSQLQHRGGEHSALQWGMLYLKPIPEPPLWGRRCWVTQPGAAPWLWGSRGMCQVRRAGTQWAMGARC